MNTGVKDKQYSYEVKVNYEKPGNISGFSYCFSITGVVYKNNLTITISSICELDSVGLLALDELLLNCKKLVAGVHDIQLKEKSNV